MYSSFSGRIRYQVVPLLALFPLLLMVWAGRGLVQEDDPFWDLGWFGEGNISFVEPGGPWAQAGLRVGDRIMAVNGVRPEEMPVLYEGGVAGDELTLLVARDGERFQLQATLESMPAYRHLAQWDKLLIGFVFWLAALAVWMWPPFQSRSLVFFLTGQLVATTAAFNVLRTTLPGGVRISNLLMILAVVLVLHFYTRFSEPSSLYLRRYNLYVSYGLACALILVTLSIPFWPLDLNEKGFIWKIQYAVQQGFLAVTLLGALWVLTRRPGKRVIRRRQGRRFVIAGLIVAILPPLALSLIPEFLWNTPLISYAWTYPFLLFIPLSHAYALYLGEKRKLDFLVNRSLVFLIAFVALTGCYTLLFLGLYAWTPPGPIVLALIAALPAFLACMYFDKIRQHLQHGVDQFFFGGWYDYYSVVRETSAELSRTVGLEQLADDLLSIVRTMRFQQAALFWPVNGSLAYTYGFGYDSEAFKEFHLPVNGSFARYLLEAGDLRLKGQLENDLSMAGLSEEERKMLSSTRLNLCLPLVSRGALRGVLIMGSRKGDAPLRQEDYDILATLGEQSAVMAENAALLESLRARLREVETVRDELAETRRQLADGRENERQLLARELHDGPIQDLYTLSHQFEGLEQSTANPTTHSNGETLQHALHQITDALRSICAGLRPPLLAAFGLEAAIRSHVERVQCQFPDLRIELHLMAEMPPLPERMRFALFRVFQEALNNVLQHADAQTVWVRLEFDVEQIVLEVRDDGCGYEVPERWVELARRGHLGMLGISERTDAIGGTLDVISAPGKGTTIRITVPPHHERTTDSEVVHEVVVLNEVDDD